VNDAASKSRSPESIWGEFITWVKYPKNVELDFSADTHAQMRNFTAAHDGL
jgi:hypothetical protein